MKRRAIITIIVMAIIALVLYIYSAGIPFVPKTYKIDGCGVSISVPTSFVKQKTTRASQLLNLYNPNSEITISVTLPSENFWNADDLEGIKNKYSQLIAAEYFDSSIIDTSSEIIKSNGKEAIVVRYTIKNPTKQIGAVTILTTKEYKNVVIEIYGLPDNIKVNESMINKIISSIKLEHEQ